MSKYEPQKIEKKWQKFWSEKKINKTKEDKKKPKFYVLDMFPYPSGSGLHVGHPKGYIATDVIARKKMMEGFNVLHPMGWDAFGLPAENYALANKIHPKTSTDKNIKTFKKQLEKIGFTYDWDREVNTTDPKFYKWTQWSFLQLFKQGLAFESFEPINWCPKCQTGLANEDLEDGKCERCGSVVERRPMRQWVLRITKYADRMLNDLSKLTEWPGPIKEMQKHWIGRSEGATIVFDVENSSDKIEVFTTRPDTVFGITYVVLAPEHKYVKEWKAKIKNYDEVEKYLSIVKTKSDLERTELQKDKTGVELKGIFAIHPMTGEKIPVWVADYVLASYGSGAVMAVPAHDERDFEFAKKYSLPIKQVVAPHFVDVVNSPRADKKTVERRVVQGIVKHWSEDKVIQLKWKKLPWKTFVIGGAEEGESLEDAVKREIQEETGYKNFKSIKQVGMELRSEWYAEHKDENRYAKMSIFMVELGGEEKDEISDSEKEKHEVTWVPFKDIPTSYQAVGELHYIWRELNNHPVSFVEDGISINSREFSELRTPEMKEKIIEWLEKNGKGAREINYKLRDWVFSRQRYWGEPIPLIYCEECKNKKQKVLMVHGFEASPETNWFRWMQKELEAKGFEVVVPEFPNSSHPVIKDWLKILQPIINEFGEDDIVVGHSLGSKAVLNAIQNKQKGKIGHVFLVASAIGEIDKRNWKEMQEKMPEKDVAALNKFWMSKTDWKKIQTKVSVGTVVVSDNDKFIPERLRGPIPASWAYEVWNGSGHFNESVQHGLFERFMAAKNTGWVAVPENKLPVELPKVKFYEPTGTGESPLAEIKNWVNTKCPKCGGPGKRETNTMPQWAGSSWYYLRYIDPKNSKELVSKEKEKYWSPVDFYVGGAEHATRHLIYARFWHKFLYDIGVVNYEEPFTRLQNVGLIMGEDNRKMSKRWGNVVNPDDVVKEHGADALRVYEMFMGPFAQSTSWSTNGLIGARRFLDKIWAISEKTLKKNDDPKPIVTMLHQTIKKVGEDIEGMRYNTAIAKMMELANEFAKAEKLSVTNFSLFVKILAPFAPHISEELWKVLGNKKSIFLEKWPAFDPELAKESTLNIAIQINGKVRDEIQISADANEESVKQEAVKTEKVQKWLDGKEPKKIIYVKGKLVSIVV